MHFTSGLLKSHVFPLLARKRTPKPLRHPSEGKDWAKKDRGDQRAALRTYRAATAARLVTADHAKNFGQSDVALRGSDRRYAATHGPDKLIKSMAAPCLRPSKMKMHHWQMIAEHMYVPVLKPLLDSLGWAHGTAVVTRFFDMLSKALEREVDPEGFDEFDQECREATRDFCRLLPPSDRALVCHLATHLGQSRRTWGALEGYWMYPFERYNQTMQRARHIWIYQYCNSKIG
jgi:hypothetical protein